MAADGHEHVVAIQSSCFKNTFATPRTPAKAPNLLGAADGNLTLRQAAQALLFTSYSSYLRRICFGFGQSRLLLGSVIIFPWSLTLRISSIGL